MYQIYTLESKNYPLIHDVIIHPFKVNKDPRGSLTEALKTTWADVYSSDMPFAQMYFSETSPGTARDVDEWHVHPSGQQDRFFAIQGTIVTAVYDARDNSPTKGLLNLFLMGESENDKGQFLLVIPKQTHHGYMVVSQTPAILGNFPTRLYDSEEEGRVSMHQITLPDSSVFSWESVKQAAQKVI